MSEGRPFHDRQRMIFASGRPPVERFILIALNEFVGADGGSCWPSHSTLSKMTGFSKSTIIRALERLQEIRIVNMQPRYREGSRERSSNCYSIAWENLSIGGVSVRPPDSSTQRQAGAASVDRSSTVTHQERLNGTTQTEGTNERIPPTPKGVKDNTPSSKRSTPRTKRQCAKENPAVQDVWNQINQLRQNSNLSILKLPPGRARLVSDGLELFTVDEIIKAYVWAMSSRHNVADAYRNKSKGMDTFLRNLVMYVEQSELPNASPAPMRNGFHGGLP